MKKQFTEIMKEEINEKRGRITENMIKKEISKIKRKKAGDRLGWKTEWIKEGGKEWQKVLLYCLIE